ncbi:MAG: PKD domain-containing protein, partial [Bacteroidetes bacterium]|nr:PKD domain-containing protein [Bacteroidota bacterium]
MKNKILRWFIPLMLAFLPIMPAMASAGLTEAAFFINSPNVLTGNDSVCAGSSATYTVNLNQGDSVAWVITYGTITGTTANTATVSWGGNPGPGNVNAIIYNNGSQVANLNMSVSFNGAPNTFIVADFSTECSFTMQDTTGENPIPGFGITDTECFVVCENSTVNYLAPNSAGNHLTWQVFGAQSFTPNGNELSVTWGAKGMGYIYLKDSLSGNCVTEIVKCVQIVEEPQAFFTTASHTPGTPLFVCKNTTVNFVDASISSPNAPIVGWVWEIDNNIFSTGSVASYEFNLPGTYEITLTVFNACNCSSTYSMTVVVENIPAYEIECVSTICEGTSEFYTVNAPCAGEWSVSAAGTIIGPNVGFSVNVLWNSSSTGFGELTFTPGPCGGCPYPLSVLVPIISTTASIFGPIPACSNKPNVYSTAHVPGSTPVWTITNGTIISNPNAFSITVLWDSTAANGTLT